MKYDKMVKYSQQQSSRKAEIAKYEIRRMLDNHERICVTELCRRTKYSKGFFYRNVEVRKELDNAVREQGAAYNPKQVIIDKAMEDTIISLKINIINLKKIIRELENKNKKSREQM